MMPVYEVATVTPSMAAKWLAENNTNNRPLFEKTIEKYAREMIAGAWTLTNQGIGFADDGTLLDGQQRLPVPPLDDEDKMRAFLKENMDGLAWQFVRRFKSADQYAIPAPPSPLIQPTRQTAGPYYSEGRRRFLH